ncbi:MAG TPA: hypothetical protein VFO55_09210 [Gemmatimonadaceae bacterium]|nr:hypothetical protein [Gemmatimonadaceae bacterium]
MRDEGSHGTIPLKLAAAALAVVGVFPLAAVIQWAPVVTWLPLAGREWAVSIAAFTVVLVALARFGGARVDAALDSARGMVMRLPPREFAAWLALFTLGASLLSAWYCFGGQPVGGDELTQRFQARILQSGRLSARAEPEIEFFSGIQTAVADGRWFSQFPVGGAALLAAGGVLGMAWIVNPILAAWTAVSTYRFAAGIASETTARITAVLFATSPFVLLMSGSQMNHVGALAFIMFALAALVSWVRAEDGNASAWAAFRIGFGFGAAATLRPYDAAAFALVVGVFQVAVLRSHRASASSLGWQLFGGAIPVALLLYVNARTTGHPFLFGYDALNAPSHRPGFHVDPMGVDFTVVQGLHHISSYLLLLNASLFGGPIPSVLLVVIALALAPRASRWDHLVVALIGILLLAYTVYWAESFFFGPRFLYVGVPLFVFLVARLPEGLRDRLRTPAGIRAARLVLPLALISAWLLPAGITSYQGVQSALAGARESNRPQLLHVERAIAAAGIQHAIVFVPDSWHGRLAARLRAIGAPALTAESMLRELDACVLQMGLDAEDRIPGPPGPERVERVARRALFAGDARLVPGVPGWIALAFAPKRVLSDACVLEMQLDQQAVMFDRFLPLHRFDDDGRLGGRVVFARDMGLRNQKLLGRFGDRTWYRYRPERSPANSSPVFIPYYEPR